jgi:hypothetical protein
VKTAFFVTVVAVLAFCGFASAQAPVAPSAQGARKPSIQNVSGTVKSTSADTVVVAGRDKGKEAEWTFAVEPTTDIRKGTKSIMAADLKPGDAVQVKFTEQDGKALARSIVVRGKGTTTAKKAKP